MSEKTQEWFIAERARTLAMLHLTRRDDLVVMNGEQGIGLDYIIYITKTEGPSSIRQFGVFLGGTKKAMTENQLDRVLRPKIQSLLFGQFPYPVCLFHFTMDDDQGYYTWLAEPDVTEDGPRLLMHEEAHCRKLDRSALDEIVSKVDRWYDAFFGRIAVKAS
jgi:hypothetical protein